jgi:hypothetical protein
LLVFYLCVLSQCVCWIYMKMSVWNPETGSPWHGCLFTMKAGIQGQEQGLILHLLERFGCTTPVGLNFLTDGLSALATQLRSLGRMGTLAGLVCSLVASWETSRRVTDTKGSRVWHCVCHRCFAHHNQYLDTADFEIKTMRKVRARVEFAAAGGHLKGQGHSGSALGSRRSQCNCRTRYYTYYIYYENYCNYLYCIYYTYYLFQMICRCKILWFSAKKSRGTFVLQRVLVDSAFLH